MKPSVYIETMIPSYLTAWPSGDLIRAAEQRQTKLWWETRGEYDLYGSEFLVRECSAGDAVAASARLAAIAELTILEPLHEIDTLACRILKEASLPAKATGDTVHIATAAVYGIDFLLSWNCRHILNPVIRRRVERFLADEGYDSPAICSPADFLSGDTDE